LVPLLLINVEKPINFELTEDQTHITDSDIVNNVVESAGKRQKVQHIMVIVVLLNDIEKLYKPEGYYILALYSGSENYQSLQNALGLLIFDLKNLKKSRFYQLNDQYWNMELFLVQIGSFWLPV
ncbi:16024_t:CDS:2, partial [Gigaspora margarita]